MALFPGPLPPPGYQQATSLGTFNLSEEMESFYRLVRAHFSISTWALPWYIGLWVLPNKYFNHTIMQKSRSWGLSCLDNRSHAFSSRGDSLHGRMWGCRGYQGLYLSFVCTDYLTHTNKPQSHTGQPLNASGHNYPIVLVQA